LDDITLGNLQFTYDNPRSKNTYILTNQTVALGLSQKQY